jgi:hypothetical protein
LDLAQCSPRLSPPHPEKRSRTLKDLEAIFGLTNEFYWSLETLELGLNGLAFFSRGEIWLRVKNLEIDLKDGHTLKSQAIRMKETSANY